MPLLCGSGCIWALKVSRLDPPRKAGGDYRERGGEARKAREQREHIAGLSGPALGKVIIDCDFPSATS